MISSTCYDLAPVRESIGVMLTSMGFEPLLSEKPTFPTLPHLTVTENCCRAVRELADLLVLIVGHRSGSIAPGSIETMTNLEYQEALRAGIPVLVFVDKAVLSLLPVWRSNPNGNFTAKVDSPRLFEFVEELRSGNRWVSEFSSLDDILTGIREKCSQLFRHLLDLRRGDEDLPSSAYRDESIKVRDLLASRPPNWEHKLFAEMLFDRLRPLVARVNALRSNGVFLPISEQFRAMQYAEWIQTRFQELMRVSPLILRAVNEDFPRAIPLTGESIDLVVTKDCADRIADACAGATKWEERLRAVTVAAIFRQVHNITLNWGGDIVLDVFDFVQRLQSLVYTPGINGIHDLQLTLNCPKGVERFSQLLEAIDKDSLVLDD